MGDPPRKTTRRLSGRVPGLMLALCSTLAGGLLFFSGTPALAATGAPEEPITGGCVGGGPAAGGGGFEQDLCGTLNPKQSARVGYYFVMSKTRSCVGGEHMPDAGRSEGEEVEGEHITVRAYLIGLEPSTFYSYCLVATNQAGETYGHAAGFATPGRAPEAPITEKCSVASLSPTSYRMCGMVDPYSEALEPHVSAEAYLFYYDTEYSFLYNKGKSCEKGQIAKGEEIVPGNAAPVSAEALALAPGTQYTYCLVSSNRFGSTSGEALSFTTASAPPTIRVDEPDGTSGSSVQASPPSQAAASFGPAVQAPVVVVPIQPVKPAVSVAIKPKALTSAQKLARALSLCRKDPKRQREGCEKRARRLYGTTTDKRRKGQLR